MKTRIFSSIEVIFYILCMHLAMFFMRPMTWTVLQEGLLYFNIGAVVESISNLLLYFAEVSVITWLLKPRNFSMAKGIFLRRILLCVFLPASCIRFLADIAHIVLENIMVSLAATIWGGLIAVLLLLIEAVALFAIFYLCKKAYSIQGEPLKKSEKSILCILIVILLIMMLCAALLQNGHLKEVLHISEKYSDFNIANMAARTITFKEQLLNVGFSLVLWCTLCFYFGIFRYFSRKFAAKTIVVRFLCVMIVTPLLIMTKYIALPNGVMEKGTIPETMTTSFEDRVLDDYKTVEFRRKTGYGQFDSEIVYKQTKVTLMYQNKEIYSYDRMPGLGSGNLIQIDVDGIEQAYRYEFDVMVYVENGEVIIVPFEEINSLNEPNESVTRMCKVLIQEGWFEALEYSFEYLKRYDADFIETYIDIYQNMTFDDAWYFNVRGTAFKMSK